MKIYVASGVFRSYSEVDMEQIHNQPAMDI